MPKSSGAYCKIPGSTLAIGDFVRHGSTWYRLSELVAETRYSRSFRGVAKDGARRVLLLDSTNVHAWRATRYLRAE